MPQTQDRSLSTSVERSNQEIPNPDQPTLRMRRLSPFHSSDGRFRRERLRLWHRLTRSMPLLACRQIFSFAIACLSETNSLVRRIGVLHTRRYDLRGVDLGEFFERTSDGTYQANRRIHGCSVDIEHLLASRHWLTAIDVELAVEAWSMGVEWCIHTHTQPSVQTLASSSPNSQTRDVIPAAIAGVTRNEECTRQKL